MNRMHTQNIMGVNFVSSSFTEVLEEIERRIEEGQRVRVITANPEMLMLARENPSFLAVLQSADLVVPDGIGIILAGKIQRKPFTERIAGFDLASSLFRLANRKKWCVYLLGASPEVIEKAKENLSGQYPDIRLVCHHGYFTPEEEGEIIRQMQELKPHLLFVGMGMAKQEFWLQEHWPHLPVRFAMGVGGTFDVLAGKVKRAPLLWRKLGVEWLYRLIQEPWRWKRMLALPRFLGCILLESLRK